MKGKHKCSGERCDHRTRRVMIVRRGARLCAGYVCFNVAQNGWKFLPQFQADPSRKFWPTPGSALKGRLDEYTLEPVEHTKRETVVGSVDPVVATITEMAKPQEQL